MKLKHAGTYFTPRPNYPCQEWFAEHYERALVGKANLDLMRTFNPALVGYYYHSIMDNYSSGDEGMEYAALAVELGIDPEHIYLHYSEETEVGVWADERIIYPAGSRVELFHGGHQNAGLREACCFLPAVRPVHVEFVKRLRNRPDFAHQGIMLDNAGPAFWNWGTRLYRGGTVAEAGIRVDKLSPWHWENLRATEVAIREAISPMPLAGNCSSAWREDFLVEPHPLDDIGMESVGNPIRERYSPLTIWERHRRAAEIGVRLWPAASISLGDAPNTVTWDEMLHGMLCYALVVGSETSHWHVQNWTGPKVPNWPETIWPKAQGHYLELLGEPTGQPPGIYTTGTSPGGFPYTIWYRPFTRGAALLRLRSPWNGSVLDDVTLPLRGQKAILGHDGTLSTPDTFTIHNGGGAILLRI